jgi:integrase
MTDLSEIRHLDDASDADFADTNNEVFDIKAYLDTPHFTEYLFEGRRGKMNSSYTSVLLKSWCEAVGYFEPNTSNHSLRKSFCRINHEKNGVPLSTLMVMLNHSSEIQTAQYLGITTEQIDDVYRNVI